MSPGADARTVALSDGSMRHSQLSLFGAPETMSLPEGFNYKDGILSSDEERVLVKQIARLPFKEFKYRGFLGKRRVVSFGWRYDFNRRELNKAENIPEFLLPGIPPLDTLRYSITFRTFRNFERVTDGTQSR